METICNEGHVMRSGDEKCPRCGSAPQIDAMAAIGAEPKGTSPAPIPPQENGVSVSANYWEGDNFKPGAIEDEADPRDYTWREVGASSAPFDWSAGYDIEAQLATKLNQPGFVLHSNDQNGSGSCGGQAFSKYDAVQRSMVEGVPFQERSAKYLYSQVFAPGGGSAGRPLGQVLVSQGCSLEALCPSYDNGIAPSEAFMEKQADITPVARADAPNAQSRSYASLAGTLNIDSIAQAIRDNYGVVIGLYGSNNGTWGGIYPQPPISNLEPPARWSHWMYFGKALQVNGKNYIGGLQSWGPGIGQNGWQFLDQNYVQQAVWGAWTLVFNPDPSHPTFTHSFLTDMHFGQQSDEVVALQTALQIDGEFPTSVPCTGYFGNITAAAIVKFQQKYGINNASSPQGHDVGPLTRGELNKLFNGQSGSQEKPIVNK